MALTRQIIAFGLLLVACPGPATAQQRGEQTPPQPQPAPAPREPRPPASTPDVGIPGGSRQVTISGRLIADTPRQPDRVIEVKLEGQSSESIGFAYTDGTGEFSFRSLMLQQDQFYYIVINAEGFKPIRERLDYLNLGGRITIFLESEAPPQSESAGASVVGLKQLQARIPGKALDEYKKALQESTKGNVGKAIERLERATKLAPDFYEAQNNLGAQYLRSRRYTDAEKAFEIARELNPAAAEPLVNLGSLYYQLGERESETGKTAEGAPAFRKAVDFLDEAIRRNPASASAHQYLGAALYKTASYEKAETTLQRALELDNELEDVRLILMNVYTRQGRFAEALQVVTAYIERNPKSPQRPAVEKLKDQIQKVMKP